MDINDIALVLPAFVAGCIILSTHVFLGQHVIQRGIIFIDLAIAQIAGVGIIVASTFGFDDSFYTLQASAFTTAILGAVFFAFTESRWKDIQEPLIGIAFILAASGSVLLLASDVHSGEKLKDILVGEILWLEYKELIFPSLVYALVFLFWKLITRIAPRIGFYIMFAICTTISVQLVGVYLVFASLIIPALSTWYLSGLKKWILAYLVGGVGYFAGLVLSIPLDLPSAALIVWMIAALGLVTFTAFSTTPGYGRSHGET